MDKGKFKNNIPAKKVFGLAVVLFLLTGIFAFYPSRQLPVKYGLDPQISFVYLYGTSTLHDWVVTAEKIEGVLSAESDGDDLKKITYAKISIPVNYLKSGKKGMDENMYKAFKAEKFPEISYTLTDHIIDKDQMNTTGELTIAGIAKNIQSKVTHQKIGKHLKFSGELAINMTDFGIKPPEFLMGAFKTGDKVSIRFYFMFCDNKNLTHEN